MPPPYNILHNHHLKRFHELGTGPFIGSTRVLPVVHSNGSSVRGARAPFCSAPLP